MVSLKQFLSYTAHDLTSDPYRIMDTSTQPSFVALSPIFGSHSNARSLPRCPDPLSSIMVSLAPVFLSSSARPLSPLPALPIISHGLPHSSPCPSCPLSFSPLVVFLLAAPLSLLSSVTLSPPSHARTLSSLPSLVDMPCRLPPLADSHSSHWEWQLNSSRSPCPLVLSPVHCGLPPPGLSLSSLAVSHSTPLILPFPFYPSSTLQRSPHATPLTSSFSSALTSHGATPSSSKLLQIQILMHIRILTWT